MDKRDKHWNWDFFLSYTAGFILLKVFTGKIAMGFLFLNVVIELFLLVKMYRKVEGSFLVATLFKFLWMSYFALAAGLLHKGEVLLYSVILLVQVFLFEFFVFKQVRDMLLKWLWNLLVMVLFVLAVSQTDYGSLVGLYGFCYLDNPFSVFVLIICSGQFLVYTVLHFIFMRLKERSNVAPV